MHWFARAQRTAIDISQCLQQFLTSMTTKILQAAQPHLPSRLIEGGLVDETIFTGQLAARGSVEQTALRVRVDVDLYLPQPCSIEISKPMAFGLIAQLYQRRCDTSPITAARMSTHYSDGPPSTSRRAAMFLHAA